MTARSVILTGLGGYRERTPDEQAAHDLAHAHDCRLCDGTGGFWTDAWHDCAGCNGTGKNL